MIIEKDHHYALVDGKIRSIDKVSAADRHLAFECPNCHSPMVPVLGKVRKHHFRHIGNKCKYDDYLHSMAEFIIRDWMNMTDNIPIKINGKVPCPKISSCHIRDKYDNPTCSYDEERTVNLKDYTDSWEREQEYKGYRADILCHGKDGAEPVFIEVLVSHPCTQEKLDSGIQIIEVKIESEEDVFDFISHPIEENDKIKFYNFGVEWKSADKETVLFNDFINTPCYSECLYNAAKARIADYIKNSDEVPLSFFTWRKCSNFDKCEWSVLYGDDCIDQSKITINLKEFIDTVEIDVPLMEGNSPIARFKPDIRLSSSKNPNNVILILINVGQKFDSKVKKYLYYKYKIIEFNLSSDKELDWLMDQVAIHEGDDDLGMTKFVNFKVKYTNSAVHFLSYIDRFVIYSSGKGFSDDIVNCNELQQTDQRREILTIYTKGIERAKLSMFGYAYAMKEIKGYKTCMFCKYHASNTNICMPYAKFGTNKYCSENNAIQCSYFRVDGNKLERVLNEFEAFRKRNIVKIWSAGSI